jgi:Arc/MetJ family transcription regulator
MRTRISIEIDDRLMRQVMRTGKGRTKRAVIEAGLQLLVQIHGQAGIRRLKGKIRFDASPVIRA